MIIFFLFLLGLCIGSFLNVLIDRLPNDETIMGRSRCDFCKHELSWMDLFPIFSYFYLGGKCRYCKKKLSLFYPLIEVFTGLSFALVWLWGIDRGDGVGLIAPILGVFSSLIVIFFADLKYHIIPDQATAAMVLFSIPIVFAGGEVIPHIVSGLGAMMSIYFLYFITRGRGMGFGDVKLAFAMGFLLGFKGGFLALYLAFLLGAIVSIFLILSKNSGLKSKIAFGPFLVGGTLIMFFWPSIITSFFDRLF